MRILVDKDIPYIHKLFGSHNKITVCAGRVISAKDIRNIDILIVRSVTKVNQKLLDDDSIKFVGTATSGIDHIDQNYLKKYGINFVYAPGNNAVAVVEYVFAALFWLAERDSFFLRDKIIGIVGVGHIGSLLHERLHSFGIHTLLCDPPLANKNISKYKQSWKSFEKLVSEADILTFHTPLIYNGTYPTWHMVDLDVLEALPSNRILINTSRGSVIDNHALLKVLESGKKLNVVLDVWETEPELSLPLLSYVDIGTAHIAGYTIESKIRSITQIYNEYCKFFNIFDTVNLSELEPSVIYYLKVQRKIDEMLLNKLIKFVHNIHCDDLLLRQFSTVRGGFDKVRRCYLDRREWSSLCIETYVDYNNEILINLGMNICCT
ncbi:4-phosphoerythronate dehydrogenase [Blochmannia endosymbiont of Camponotus sp.]|uniref:4-phosphoerythronate dehydrogenase n=1 Tax=Blochmannia endosymbiont of Camponotus sp. TaxID=700220 RepID=UPI002023BFD5|nr:4-phosphoerythronate dehydrogenase [Blochmannia endosymbiont of Camponotus sp.]URJ29904.1 4-phosphoerythronate dehydrogenase [Blochmannia endosymbiont of Camponotus sp.]URJ31198.1 4-phosphoerythronate dehydrogenase [Blochmannia endosymbiont of Camponotus sp.]